MILLGYFLAVLLTIIVPVLHACHVKDCISLSFPLSTDMSLLLTQLVIQFDSARNRPLLFFIW